LTGSKVNQVEQIPLNDLHEITIGRDPGSGIVYDQRRDDVVSRQHAAIRIDNGGDKLAFKLADLNSSNGTLLNGKPVTGEVELVPEDTVELGRGGPKFTFDVQPRPDNLTSRTRVMDAMDATATRAIATAAASVTATRERGATAPVAAGPAKTTVGKETVLRMLFQERQKSSRVWMSSIAAVLAVLLVAGGGLYWHNRNVANQLREEAERRTEQARLDAERNVTQQIGATAKEIVNKYGNSAVVVELGWRLYDAESGKPLYHKVVSDKKTLYPAFIQLPGGAIVRWLTVDDQDKANIPVAGSGSGSGFVVSENGFILTNKHVAAGWMLSYDDLGTEVNKEYGWVFPYKMDAKKQKGEKVAINSLQRSVKIWVPESGGLVFRHDVPFLLGGSMGDGTPEDRRVFRGRNDLLEVRFPGNRVSMQATLVRASTDADAALIKVEAAQTLKPVELAPKEEDEKIDVGDKVIVLGFPAVSSKTRIRTLSVEPGRIGSGRIEEVPEPTVNEGIISLKGAGLKHQGSGEVEGTRGDTYQMSVNSTGPGNSGGPVFNAKGQVIGLYTYGSGDRRVSFAVPIAHGRELLSPQRN
jgi:S1-C subfamily serine protease/pSer/pThr/pTyr-binding forkhead associated (FHA) protein